MFLNQAVMQFELWTKQPAPVDIMRHVLEALCQQGGTTFPPVDAAEDLAYPVGNLA